MPGRQQRLTPYIVRSFASLWVGLLLTAAAVASALDVCDGPYKGGHTPTAEALSQVLQAHATWLLTPQHPTAQRANLCGADLRGARLSGANLARVDLHGAILARALLGRANLQEADLRQANLQKAILGEANLQGANLQHANLSGAYLAEANLQRSNLLATNLRDAMLLRTDLREAQLGGADLRRVVAKHANLARTILAGTDLREANLSGVDLGAAALVAVRLDGARLIRTEFSAVVFEPDVVALPPAVNFAQARSLSRLTFQTSPHGLVKLREIFHQAGMRQEARALTFAINHALGRRAHPAERAIRFVFFELTCQYGMTPGRPLLILGVLMLCGALPYMFILRQCAHGQACPDGTRRAGLRYWAAPALIALCFSLVAALRLGRYDTRFDHWLRRLMLYAAPSPLPRWVRSIATLQCFSSIYLVVLWALVTFGQPFE
jgi:uncharacterized protein YjbI with pentapeptide repeats